MRPNAHWIRDAYRKSRQAFHALLYRRIAIECDGIPFSFDNVPLKKIINWILVEASCFFRSKRPWGWPTHVQIEPTSFCDLKCALCPVTKGLKRPTQHMDLDTFKKYIDEMKDYLLLIVLWDWGEPFLNPKIYQMITYASQHQIKIISSTNGHVFARSHHAEKVVKSGLDTLIFAVDGLRQDTYQRYRQNGCLKTLVTGIQKVAAAKKDAKSNTPIINMRFIAMKHNEHEIQHLNDYAAPLGVDVVTLKTLNPHEDGNIAINEQVTNSFIPVNTRYQRFVYDKISKTRIRRKVNPCKDLWNSPAIHSNGDVCICTYDADAEYVMGNIEQHNFKQIWYNFPYKTIRRKFRQNYRQIPICSGCSFAFEGGACNTETIVEVNFF